jgi:hypothetical protein
MRSSLVCPEDLDRFAVVHRPIAVGNLVEARDPVIETLR